MSTLRILPSIIALTLTASVFGSHGSDHSEAALRQLHRATKIQKDNSHLLSLAALRALRDPDLRPFFHQFSQHPHWAVQVHAVLGLAELDDEKTIDPWLVQQISPTAREHVIAQGLDDGLFRIEQIETLLKWPLLEISPRLLLLADLQLLTEIKNTEMLKELSNNTDLTVAMFAALLSEDEKSISDTTTNLRRATRTDRSKSLQRTFQLIRQYKPKSTSVWLQNLLENNSVSLTDQERYWALYTLLWIDQTAGLKVWDRAFSTEPDRGNQVKYLLLLLEAGIAPTADHVKRLQIDLDDSLLGLMVRAAMVNKNQSEVATEDLQALVELVQKGHRSSTEWAFRVAMNHLTDEHAKQFYASLSVIPESPSPRRIDVAIKSFIFLIDIAPEKAWEILQNSKDDSAQQELLLLAMLQIPNEDTIKEAAKIRRIGLNKADIMTLLLIARSSTPLQENDQEHLGIIAAGGGHLSQGLETQAAWLYLKRMGLADKALAAVRPK